MQSVFIYAEGIILTRKINGCLAEYVLMPTTKKQWNT